MYFLNERNFVMGGILMNLIFLKERHVITGFGSGACVSREYSLFDEPIGHVIYF